MIICGGDGTISWVINELIRLEVNLGRCALGVIPIGTGNDFCRTIGWPDYFYCSVGNFRSQVDRWMKASVEKYDIWDVRVETYPGGKVWDIKSRLEREREESTLRKCFTNYVGVGLDARVVYTVEKIRTPSATINKVLYGLIGCVNFFLRPLKDLSKKLLSFSEEV